MLEGILWDNDGVLVDSERHYYAVNRDILEEHGASLSEVEFFEWFLRENRGAWHRLEARGYAPERIAELRLERNARYSRRLHELNDLAIAGIEPGLAALSPRLRMGIVTSARREHFEAIHRKLPLLKHFEFALTAGDYAESKPSPEPYRRGLERLGIDAGRCVVVEDSPRGLESARAAGLRCIILRQPMTRHYPFDGAFRVVDDAADLFAVLEDM